MINHAKYQEFIKTHAGQEVTVLGEKITIDTHDMNREYELEEIVDVFCELGKFGVCCRYDNHNEKWLVMKHKDTIDVLCPVGESYLGAVLDSIDDKTTAVSIANAMNHCYQGWALVNNIDLDPWIRSDYTEEHLA